MAKNYEMLTKKANNILKWLPEWICNRYTSVTVDRYGHLFERHFERDSKHLKERCLMEHKNSTAFFVGGKEGQAKIQNLILNTLLDETNIQDIAFWLSDPQDFNTLEIEVENETPIGHGYAYIDGKAVHKVTNHFNCLNKVRWK